jgi:trk/ktr system potassium uptake protein
MRFDHEGLFGLCEYMVCFCLKIERLPQTGSGIIGLRPVWRFIIGSVLPMRILILGGGSVGQTLALRMTRDGHEVTLVEADPTRATDLENQLQALIVRGSASDIATLKEAGIESTDLLIAVTNDDEANMLACACAHHYGVKTKVTRVRKAIYHKNDADEYPEILHIDFMINPETQTAVDIRRIAEVPLASEVREFADGQIMMVAFRITPAMPLVGKRLSELRMAYPDLGFVVTAIVRGGTLTIPHGDNMLRDGDRVFIMLHHKNLERIGELSGSGKPSGNRAIIMGASKIGVELARLFEEEGRAVTLVDLDQAKCEAVAGRFSRTMVVRGDATEPGLLRELGIADAAVFVSTSKEDEINVLAAWQAKNEGAQKVIAVVRKPNYSLLVSNTVPLDSVISPRLATVNAISRFVRRGKIISVVSVGDSGAEAVEFVAEEKSPIVGKTLRDLSFPSGAIIGAVVRGGEAFIPKGTDVILSGDRIVVTMENEAVPKVERLMSRATLRSKLLQVVEG